MKRNSHRPNPFLRLIAASFFLLGCFLLYLASPLSRASHVESNIGPVTLKIEDIQVGQRVWADNPDVETTSETAVDPVTWKRIRLRAEAVWDDGTLDDINIVTLQSPEWIARHEARVGATVPIPLDLVEMGLPVDMRAKVLDIERCPAIEGGAGRVVLTTVNHLNRDAYQITVEDADGRREVSRPTGLHKFYRPTDGQWISAKTLKPGDQLRDTHGHAITVVSVKPLPGVHRVYNLTVEGEHVYHVSTLGLLVHNNDCSISIPSKQYQDNWAQAFGGNGKGGNKYNFYGSSETSPGFIDVTAEPLYAQGNYRYRLGDDGVIQEPLPDRILSSQFADGSAERIFIRSAEFNKGTISEVVRLSQPGTKIDVVVLAGSDPHIDDLLAAFGGRAQVEWKRTIQYGMSHIDPTHAGQIMDHIRIIVR